MLFGKQTITTRTFDIRREIIKMAAFMKSKNNTYNNMRLLLCGSLLVCVVVSAIVASAGETKCVWNDGDSGEKKCDADLKVDEKLYFRCPKGAFEVGCGKPLKSLKSDCAKEDMMDVAKLRKLVPGYTVEITGDPNWPTNVAYNKSEIDKGVKVYQICSDTDRENGWLLTITMRGKDGSSAVPTAASFAVLVAAFLSVAGAAAF